MKDVGIFYGHLVHFMDFWYGWWLFGMFFPVLVFCTKKNLATLVSRRMIVCNSVIQMAVTEVYVCISLSSKLFGKKIYSKRVHIPKWSWIK
jgi:hypothetical protein